MREIARSIARERMKKVGFQRMNKKNPKTGKSPFSVHWREFVNYCPNTVVVQHHKKRVKQTPKIMRLLQSKGLFA